MSPESNQTGLEIAIIGMAGKFPGARDISQFWENLKNGVESIAFFTDEEIIEAGIDPLLLENPDFVRSSGGVLEDREYFDASFFGYSAVEAELMDPQVRIFHECAWHALENAGYNPLSYEGLIGLYAGASFNLYWEALSWLSGHVENLGDFAALLIMDRDYLCTRVSYNLNLKGPSVVVKTACSTSMVAVHMACQGILNGECDMALAGGATIILLRKSGYLYQEGMILSPDGHCRAFDQEAKGTASGDGVGVVVLKRLEDAIKAGDNIHAVIKGTAINNDGIRKAGYTAPSVVGQAEVISEAYEVAELDPETITYIETHGTGTPLGDPIEIEALKMAFNTDKKGFCRIGSVKSNIGHLDSAAGVASLIKTILALKHQLIPPSLHFQTPSPKIDFENSPFYVNSKLSPWKHDGHPLRAGVSSFGIGGTNVHVILEEAPEGTGRLAPPSNTRYPRQYQLILLSAKTQTALDKMTRNLTGYLKGHPGINLADTAYTLQVGRAAFPHRRMVVGADVNQVIEALSSPEPGKHPTFHLKGDNTSAVFMFPGLGSQYVNMGLGLYEREPVFREEMDRCFEILEPLLAYDIKEILYPSDQSDQSDRSDRSDRSDILINQFEIAQVVVFILEYALAKLLMNWGVKPYAMIGYSFGEYTAACLSGVFSPQDALKLIVYRGQLIGQGSRGSMLSVPLTAGELIPMLPGDLSLAIDNGPSCIVSGSVEAVDAFEKQLKEKKYLSMKVPNSHALHSKMMEPILKEFQAQVGRIKLNKPEIPYISNVTGKWITVQEAVDPAYWARHLRETVRFAAGIAELKQESNAIFIEVGPGRDLSTLLVRHQEEQSHHPAFNLVRQDQQDIPDHRYLLNKIGHLWVRGIKINWQQFHANEKRYRLPLPIYPFDRQYYWIEGDPYQVVKEMSGEISTRQKNNPFYLPSWEPSVLPLGAPSKNPSPSRSCWLMFIPGPGFASQLGEHLQEDGITVVSVKPGTGFKKINDSTYSINPGKAGNYDMLVKDLQAAGRVPRTIVHLWGITGNSDRGQDRELEPEQVEQQQEMGLYSLMHLAHCWGKPGPHNEDRFEIKVVTNNMQKVPGDETLYPGKTPVLAAVKMIPRQYPNMTCCSIDVSLPDPGTWQEKRLIKQLSAELKQEIAHPEVALRGYERLVQSYAPVRLPNTNGKKIPPRLKEKGIYLITGKYEGIGFEMAQYLARTLKPKLVFITHTHPLDENQEEHHERVLTESSITMNLKEESNFLSQTGKKLDKKLGIKGIETYEGLEAKMNEFCSACILDYFKQEAIDTEVGKIYGYEDLEKKLAILPKFDKFYDFFIRVLQDDKIIAVKDNKITFLKAASQFKDSPTLKKEIEKRYPQFKGTLGVLRHCSSHYARALKGEIEAISVLYPEGNMIWALEEYHDSVEVSNERLYVLLFQELLARIMEKSTGDKPLRILEVGAGNGILTGVIAPGLKDRNVEYFFTDIGNFFVVNARKLAAERGLDFMKFGVFDITKDPVHQGYEKYSFDVIVGLNVVHATRFIETSLGNLKQLLGANGILCLIEGMNPKRWLHMVDGLAEGWWYFEDTHIRTDSPLVDLDTWERIFEKMGFQNVTAFPQDKTGRSITDRGIILGQQEKMVHTDKEIHQEKTGHQDLKMLEAVGAEVQVLQADITDPHQIRETIDRVQTRWGDICGLILCSPVPGNEGEPGESGMEPVPGILANNIRGLLELDRIFKDKPLDFFILCSSLDANGSSSHPRATITSWATRLFHHAFSHFKLSRDGQFTVTVDWDPHAEASISQLFESIFQPSFIFPQVLVSPVQPALWTPRTGESPGISHPDPVKTPGPSITKHQRPELSTDYVPPTGEIETMLARIWQEFLGIGEIGIYDDFLEIGADSLVFITIAARIQKALNIIVPIPVFFSKLNIKGLTEYIREAQKQITSTMEPTEKKEYYPSTSIQRRLFFLQQIDKQALGYNIPRGSILEGKLDRNRFQDVCRHLVNRHESFRTAFEVLENGEVVQRLYDSIDFGVEFYDISGTEIMDNPNDFLNDRFVRPFDLFQAPLGRLGLVKMATDKHLLMVDVHHIIADGIAIGIFVGEFMSLYNREDLPPLRIQYKDYSEWLDSEEMTKFIKQQEEYWLREFAGEIQVLELPTDFHRPAIQRFEGRTSAFEIDKQRTEALRALALEGSSTLNMVMLALYNIFLHKVSSQEEIGVGTTMSDRRHSDLEHVVGMFVKTLVLRNFPAGHKYFNQFTAEVKERTLEAYSNQDYPYEDIVEQVVQTRDTSRNPLFDAMFIMENFESPLLQIPGLTLRPFMYEQIASLFDLSLLVVENEDFLWCSFEYSTNLFKHSTIQRFINYFNKITGIVIENPGIKIADIQVISEEEKKCLLYDFNETGAEYTGDRTIHRLFARQSEKTPDHIAVFAQNQSPGSAALTYRELHTRAARLAALLRNKGIGTGCITAIMMEPALEMMTAIIGVLKAGTCYLPLDPQNPQERMTYILNDSEAVLLLTQPHLVHQVKGDIEILPIRDKSPDQNETHHDLPGKTAAPGDPVYMIYTSGTTGKPKGVLIKHENLVNYVNWFTTETHLTGKDSTLLTSSFAFDLGYTTIYPALLTGAPLHILPRDVYMLTGNLLDYIRTRGISYIKVTPSFFAAVVADPGFSREACKTLRLVVLGGEAINVIDVEKMHQVCQHINVMNHYGPTEVTIGCIAQFIDFEHLEEYKARPTIGRPIFNTRVYIIDKYLKLLPVGIAGELCLSGAGVAKGYFKRETLTSEKFITNIFGETKPVSHPYDRVYRTGDLARWLHHGYIEFLGRIDQQIKIRGFRIELGEIENQLLNHEEIKESVVLAKSDQKGDKYLCAYIVAGIELNRAELVKFLSVKLPDYMIPAHIVPLENIPLTPNGKIDKRVLPEPELGTGTEQFVAPGNDTEKKLAGIWSEVLGIENNRISIDASFFGLGGHSLRATIMMNRINKELNVDVPLAVIFQMPTIKELAAYIKRLEKSKFEAVAPVEKRDYYPLSSAQKRMYILMQIDARSLGYNIPIIHQLEGNMDVPRFEHTFRTLIKRHESLRSSFVMVNGEPVQRIHAFDHLEFEFEYFNLTPGQGTFEGILKGFIRPFDLSRAPLARVGLIKEEETRHMLAVDMHHIITDGTSMGRMFREFMSVYGGEELLELRIQYKDFSGWQNRKEIEEIIKKQEAYWLKEFEDEIPVLNLPTDFARPLIQRFEGRTITFQLDEETIRGLRKYTLEKETTFFMVLLTVYNVFLAKICGQEDIVAGVPIAGRRHADLQPIVGLFLNNLAMRNFPKPGKTFKQFLEEIEHRSLQAFENQDYPYEELVEKVVVNRDASRNPLYDTMFALHNFELPQIEIPGLTGRYYQFEQGMSRFDIILQCMEEEGQLSCFLEYSTNLFKPDTIERLINYFRKVIAIVIENPDIKIGDMEIISEQEKTQLLFDFNDTDAGYPKEKVLHQLFEEQVEKTPGHIAILFTGQYLSYQAFNKTANRLAGVFRKKGVTADIVVGIMVKRSLEMLIGIMAILKAGGAYLPIDPQYPGERIKYMLKDSAANILVTQQNGLEKMSGTFHTRKILDIDKMLLPVVHHDEAVENEKKHSHHPGNMAYVIYTSGSTGKPKGVTISHRNVINFIYGITAKIRFLPGKAILALTTLSFDIFVLETLLPPVNGLKIVIANEDQQRDPQLLADKIVKENVNMLQMTPSSLKLLNDSEVGLRCLQEVEVLMVGGESFPRNLFKRLKAGYKGQIYNMYGPTETTVWSSLSNLTGIEKIDIGVPIANTRIYIIDRYNTLLPIGVVGELCIGGDGLSRGYLNRPELTAEKFDHDLWDYQDYHDEKNKSFCGEWRSRGPRGAGSLKWQSALPHTLCAMRHAPCSHPLAARGKLYRTGDLARWLSDGNLECLGRIDSQVKLRGFRIELGEIENQLLNHEAIKDAVVSINTDNKGDKYLCAYIISEKEIDMSELREFLSTRLTDYMIPNYFVPLEHIPLTPNGKIDRKALPGPETGVGTDIYVPPRNHIEEKLLEIWSQVLALEKAKISIEANFFRLGGHSLRATTMIARINKEFDVRLSLAEVFKTPNIIGLSEYITSLAKDKYSLIEPVEKKEYYASSSAQKRLYILQQMELDSTAYNMPEVFPLPKESEVNKFEKIFNQLIQRHESLRTSFLMVNREPEQKIHHHTEFAVEYYETRGEEELEKITAAFMRPFDLSTAPLLRVGLLKSEERYLLLIDMHHIISDGVSHEILTAEFLGLYDNHEQLAPMRI